MKSASKLKAAIVMAGSLVAISCIAVQPGGIGLPADPSDAPPGTIQIRLLNNTPFILDPQLFVASGDVLDLFNPENRVTGIGTGMQGLLSELTIDTLDFPCEAIEFIGTPGGIFFDPGPDQAEIGRTRSLTAAKGQGLQFECEDTVVLTFSTPDGESQFVVQLARQ
jgi:hypothetical protein